MLVLVVEKGGPINQRFELSQPKSILGRISGCDVVIPYSHEISRRHAQIEFQNNQYLITDLKSANGTKVNNRILTPGESFILHQNDRVTIADEMTFRVELVDQELVAPVYPLQQEDATQFESSSRIISAKSVLDAFETNQKVKEITSAEETAIFVKNKSNLLQILNRVEKELIAIRPIDEYLKLVMDIVFDMLPADRGFLMLKDEETGDLKSKQIKLRQNSNSDTSQWIHFSKTITQKVIEDNVAIITRDAIQDARFSDGESIYNIGIRSAMCVPLWNKDNVLGTIYVDNLSYSNVFDDDALVLLSAFANHAAIGIEQARLHEQLLLETRKRERLERYHSPEIVDRIIQKDHVSIEAIECEVAVLFCDIVGFSTKIENMLPNEISDLLNDFYTMATNAIFRNQGTLDKFIGDNVMAIFGAPIASEDNAQRAVKCAREMIKSLVELNDDKPPQQQIELRIGINSGKVIAGDFGSMKRIEYTVLGDTVNIASRLESQVAQPGQIVVGEAAYALTKDEIEYQDLGRFAIKGKAEKVRAYLVVEQPEELIIY